jgi:hypothetical protein
MRTTDLDEKRKKVRNETNLLRNLQQVFSALFISDEAEKSLRKADSITNMLSPRVILVRY